jgi:hypothetical protein
MQASETAETIQSFSLAHTLLAAGAKAAAPATREAMMTVFILILGVLGVSKRLVLLTWMFPSKQ